MAKYQSRNNSFTKSSTPNKRRNNRRRGQGFSAKDRAIVELASTAVGSFFGVIQSAIEVEEGKVAVVRSLVEKVPTEASAECYTATLDFLRGTSQDAMEHMSQDLVNVLTFVTDNAPGVLDTMKQVAVAKSMKAEAELAKINAKAEAAGEKSVLEILREAGLNVTESGLEAIKEGRFSSPEVDMMETVLAHTEHVEHMVSNLLRKSS